MRLGIQFAGLLDLPTVARLAREAEEAGFDSVWVGEFWRASFTQAGYLAGVLRRASLGTAITLAFPRSPFVTALSALDLDEATGGRFVLGLGAGTHRIMTEWHNAPFHPPLARLAEYADLLRALWRHWAEGGGGEFAYEGRFYRLRFAGHRREPPPVRERIPIYFAGVNPRAVEWAGRHADGLVAHLLHTRDYLARQVRPTLETGARSAGRDPRSVHLVAMVQVAVDPDPAEAYRRVALALGMYAFNRAYDPLFQAMGVEEDRTPLRRAYLAGDREGIVRAMPRSLVDACALYGPPEVVREGLRAYEGLADTVLLYPAFFGLSPETALANYRAVLSAVAGLSR